MVVERPQCFFGSRVIRESTFRAVGRMRRRNYKICILINKSHLATFLFPILSVVLDNAEFIDSGQTKVQVNPRQALRLAKTFPRGIYDPTLN